MKLKNKLAIVTGQSRGLGAAIAAAFKAEGAIVPECTRKELDLTDQLSIETFYESVLAEYDQVDILVNNAAILGHVGDLRSLGMSSLQEVLTTNLLGPIYLTQRCLPALQRSKRGKIINILGGGASSPLPRRLSYAVSKAGLARFTDTLAAEVINIDCNGVLPGPLKTGMLDDILAAGPEILGQLEYALHSSFKEGQQWVSMDNKAIDPIENAAQLCVFLASEQSNGLTGKMISARWDNWREWDVAEVMKSDKYTLRRID